MGIAVQDTEEERPQPVSRRRGKALERAILGATREELREVGYANLTVDAVATRARTSKPVIYRRWKNRADLVVASIVDQMPTAEAVPDTGDLRSDVLALLYLVRQRMTGIGRFLIIGLLADAQHDPELLADIQGKIVSSARRAMMRRIMERAGERGEVDMAVIPERVMMLPLDLFAFEILARGNADDCVIREIVDDVFLPLVQRT